MSPYIKITGRTFTIWLLASLINGLLCGISLSVLHNIYSEITGDIIGIAFISLFFSVPGFLVFWFILLIRILMDTKERALFRSALVTGFILALITAIFGSKLFSSEFGYHFFIPFTCIMLSAVSSIMLHFKYFKNIK